MYYSIKIVLLKPTKGFSKNRIHEIYKKTSSFLYGARAIIEVVRNSNKVGELHRLYYDDSSGELGGKLVLNSFMIDKSSITFNNLKISIEKNLESIIQIEVIK